MNICRYCCGYIFTMELLLFSGSSPRSYSFVLLGVSQVKKDLASSVCQHKKTTIREYTHVGLS